MICNTFSKETFKEIEESRKIGKTQYYYVRFNPITLEDGNIMAIEHELNHYPSVEEIDALKQKYLDGLRKGKILQVQAYDCSPVINRFIVNGQTVWMDKDTRVGITNALRLQKDKEETTTSIMFGEVWYTLPVEEALSIMASIEIYAMACFKQTAEHLSIIKNLDSIEALSNYDFTTGYPEVREFTINITSE